MGIFDSILKSVPIVGPLLEGVTSAFGADSANKANARNAQDNRDFQERMSNSAHQRAFKDMKKAGLNPILAAGNPATTPGGNLPAPSLNLASGAKGTTQSALLGAQQISMNSARVAEAKAEERFYKKHGDAVMIDKFTGFQSPVTSASVLKHGAANVTPDKSKKATKIYQIGPRERKFREFTKNFDKKFKINFSKKRN